MLGLPELLVILFIILLFFGGSRLPKLSRTIGESAKELKDSFNGEDGDAGLKEIAKDMAGTAKELKDSAAQAVKNTRI